MPTLRVEVEAMRGHVAVGRQEQDGVLPLDRPVSTGGTGLGFNGGHLMLMGWAACFKSNLVAAAEARDIPIERLHISAWGEIVSGPARFGSVAMEIVLEGPTGDDRDRLVTIARNGCAVSNTLAAAVPMTVELVDAAD